MTFAITFSDPWIPVATDDEDDRRDISTLADKSDHIHGRLSIVVNGMPLKYLGYFRPDDVCWGAWLVELRSLLNKLSKSTSSRYVYDEGEQGQPAFQFVRDADRVDVSIIDSEVDGAQTNPIERVWWDFHEDITRNHKCRDLPELLGNADEWFLHANHHFYREMRFHYPKVP